MLTRDCRQLVPALDDIELNFRRDFENGDKEASLVFTGERVKNKFFSNGLDLALVAECPGFFKVRSFPRWVRRS